MKYYISNLLLTRRPGRLASKQASLSLGFLRHSLQGAIDLSNSEESGGFSGMNKAFCFVLFGWLGNVWDVGDHSPGEGVLGSQELGRPEGLCLPSWP